MNKALIFLWLFSCGIANDDLRNQSDSRTNRQYELDQTTVVDQQGDYLTLSQIFDGQRYCLSRNPDSVLQIISCDVTNDAQKWRFLNHNLSGQKLLQSSTDGACLKHNGESFAFAICDANDALQQWSYSEDHHETDKGFLVHASAQKCLAYARSPLDWGNIFKSFSQGNNGFGLTTNATPPDLKTGFELQLTDCISAWFYDHELPVWSHQSDYIVARVDKKCFEQTPKYLNGTLEQGQFLGDREFICSPDKKVRLEFRDRRARIYYLGHLAAPRLGGIFKPNPLASTGSSLLLDQSGSVVIHNENPYFGFRWVNQDRQPKKLVLNNDKVDLLNVIDQSYAGFSFGGGEIKREKRDIEARELDPVFYE